MLCHAGLQMLFFGACAFGWLCKAGFRPQVDGLRIVSAVVSYRLYRFSSWLLHKQGKLVSVVSAVSLVSVVTLSDGSYRPRPAHAPLSSGGDFRNGGARKGGARKI